MAKQITPISNLATVDNVQGEGHVLRPDGSTVRLQPGMQLREGDVVVTQQGALANILLAQGGAIQCGKAGAKDAVAIDKTVLSFFADPQEVEKVGVKTAEAAAETIIKASQGKDLNEVMEATAAGVKNAQAAEAGAAANDPVVLQGIATNTQGQDLNQTLDATAAGGTTETAATNTYVVLQPISTATSPQTFTNTIVTTSPTVTPIAPAVAPMVVNQPSVLEPDTQTASEDSPATGNVLSNDSDPDDTLAVASFSIQGVTAEAGQTLIIVGAGTFTMAANGDYTFTPEANWNGSLPQVTYTTSTGSSSTLDITVTPVDDASVMVADANTVAEGSPAIGNVLGNDSDVDNTLSVATFTVDGQTFTAGPTAQTIEGVGTIVLDTDGGYTFTPAENYNGAVPTVTYTTNTGSSSTLDITVTPVDDASLLVADTNTVDEDTPATGNVLGNDSDVDSTLSVASFTVGGQTYTAGSTAQTIAGVGTIVVDTNGGYTFTPAANYNGTVPTITYTTNTGSTSTLDITVTPLDDASVLVVDTKTVAEGSPAIGNVLGNDSDVDNTLSVASFTVGGQTFTAGPTAQTIAGVGTIVLDTDGGYTFIPAANYNGAVPTITYTTNTGSSSTLNITVTPVDDASVLVADTNTVNEDNPATSNVLGNDSDVDNTLSVASFTVGGQTFTAGPTAQTIAGVGTIVLDTNGGYTFTPAANYNGTVPTVTYTTNTGSSSTLNITVTPVGDASVLVADTATVVEDAPAIGNVLGNDNDVDSTLSVASFTVDGQTYTAGPTVQTISGVGTIVLDTNGGYTFTPAENYNGAVPTISYTTNTGSTSTLDITVTPVDDASVLVADVNTVDEDTPATGNVLGNDSDVDNTLSVTGFSVGGQTFTAGTAAQTIANVGTIVLDTNGDYTFTPDENYNGTVPTITYTTNTGSSSTLNITVTPVDDASVLAADTATVAEDTPATGNVLGNDNDVDSTLSVASFTVGGQTYTAGPTVQTISGVGTIVLDTNGGYTFTPAANYNGAVPTITYTTSTGNSSTLNITVTPVDDASVLVADTNTVDEDTPATGNVLGNDSDVDNTLSVASFTVDGQTYTAGPTAQTIAGVGAIVLDTNGGYTFTPAANYNGAVPTITYTTSTGNSSTLNITVTPVDDASVLVADVNTVDEDTPATGNVLGNDSDVDNTLSVASFTVGGQTYTAGPTVQTIAGVGTIVLDINGGYTFTPAANYNGTVPTITYTTNTGSSSTLNITVTPVDDASVLVADTNTVDEDTPATGNVLGNDSDVDNTLSVASFAVGGQTYTAGPTAQTIAGVGTIVLDTNGGYTFTPAANYNGAVPTVSYTTNKGSTSTLDISVTPVNDPPTAASDTISMDEDTAYSGTLPFASDIDQDVVIYALATDGQASHGSVTVNADGTYSYLPDANYNGTDSFSYTVSDGKGGLNTYTVNITVNPVTDTTTVSLSALPVSEGAEITVTATVDKAPETDLTITLSNDAVITIAAGQTSGSVTFANPNAEDAIVDGETLTYGIMGTSGGGYESLDTKASVDVVVSDTTDKITVSIAADGDVTEDGKAVFTVSVSQALADDLDVTLSDGQTVKITAGATSVKYEVAAQGDDVYVDPGKVELSVSSAEVTGKTFENLEVSKTSATVNITDTIDAVLVKLSVDKESIVEGGAVTYTATLYEADGTTILTSNPYNQAITVNLTGGGSITIAANAVSGTTTKVAATDDSIIDQGTVGELSQTISTVSLATGTPESLTADSTAAVTDITDDTDAVKLSLTGPSIVAEGSQTADYTLTLKDASGAAVAAASDVTVTLSYTGSTASGADYTAQTTVTIASGQSSATFKLNTASDAIADSEETIVTTISDVSGGGFESLSIDSANNSVTTTITEIDGAPTIELTAISPAADSLQVDESNLSVDRTIDLSTSTTFTVNANFGTDGAGSTTSSYALSVQSSGANSGLIDAATGRSIHLFLNGGSVMGRVANAQSAADPLGDVAFVLSVDATGKVTLDQQRALRHSPNTGTDQEVSLSADNLVMLTRTDTIVDRDGDSATASASINLGSAISFKDDAPVASKSQSVVTVGLVGDTARNDVTLADLGVNVGADTGGMISLTGAGTPVKTADGMHILTLNGSALTYVLASDNKTMEAKNAAGAVAFSVTPGLDPVTGKTSYAVTVVNGVDPIAVDTFKLATGSSVQSGNSDVLVVNGSAGGTLTLRGLIDSNSSSDISWTTSGKKNETSISSSTQGIGVGNNFVTNSNNSADLGEMLRLEFNTTTVIEGVGLKVDGLGAGETLYWRTVTINHSTGAYSSTPPGSWQGSFGGTGSGSSSANDKLLVINPSNSFNAVELWAAEGSDFRILQSEIILALSNSSATVEMAAVVTDADGDSVTQKFSVKFDDLLSTDSKMEGASGSDVIDLSGSTETIAGLGGLDSFEFDAGDSTSTISGTSTSATVSGFDVLTDYSTANGTLSAELLNLPGIATVAADTTTGDGTNITINGVSITHHQIDKGILTFFNGSTQVGIDNATLAAAVDYLSKTDLGNAGVTVAFKVGNTSATSGFDTYVYSQTGDTTGGHTLVRLEGVSAAGLTTDSSLKTQDYILIS